MPAPEGPGWTDERIELLKKEWFAGSSCSQIAKSLGFVSRNAVIGKIHRLGLSAGAGRVRQAASRPSRAPRAATPKTYGKGVEERDYSAHARRIQAAVSGEPPAPASEPLPTPAAVMASAKTIVQLGPKDCRFPVGTATGADMLHCGARVPEGRYCTAHRALAFTPPKYSHRDLERGVKHWAGR